jgi:hypothetical protein
MKISHNNWNQISEIGIPENTGEPFMVYCPNIDPNNPENCVKLGMHTTHNRGIGIRPAGSEYYHFHNDCTHWKYTDIPPTSKGEK